jgi:hypothetical protein
MELRVVLLRQCEEKDRQVFRDETFSNFGDFYKTLRTVSSVDLTDVDNVFNPFFERYAAMRFYLPVIMTFLNMVVMSLVGCRMVTLAFHLSSELRQKKIVERCWSTSSHCQKLRQSFLLNEACAALETVHDFSVLVNKLDFLNLLTSIKMQTQTARRIFTMIDDGNGVCINFYLLTLLRISGSGSENLNLTSILYENRRNAERLELMMEFLVQVRLWVAAVRFCCHVLDERHVPNEHLKPNCQLVSVTASLR